MEFISRKDGFYRLYWLLAAYDNGDHAVMR